MANIKLENKRFRLYQEIDILNAQKEILDKKIDLKYTEINDSFIEEQEESNG